MVGGRGDRHRDHGGDGLDDLGAVYQRRACWWCSARFWWGACCGGGCRSQELRSGGINFAPTDTRRRLANDPVLRHQSRIQHLGLPTGRSPRKMASRRPASGRSSKRSFCRKPFVSTLVRAGRLYKQTILSRSETTVPFAPGTTGTDHVDVHGGPLRDGRYVQPSIEGAVHHDGGRREAISRRPDENFYAVRARGPRRRRQAGRDGYPWSVPYGGWFRPSGVYSERVEAANQFSCGRAEFIPSSRDEAGARSNTSRILRGTFRQVILEPAPVVFAGGARGSRRTIACRGGGPAQDLQGKRTAHPRQSPQVRRDVKTRRPRAAKSTSCR